MKNIRSSKGQDGFIGALVGLIAGLFILYVVVVALMFVVGFIFVNKENTENREYRASFTDTEWIVKEGYENAQRRYCEEDPNRDYDTFKCSWTEAEWSKTPSAIKLIVRRLGNLAGQEWAEENVIHAIQKNGLAVKRYPSMSKVPCTYTYLNKTYNCEDWR